MILVWPCRARTARTIVPIPFISFGFLGRARELVVYSPTADENVYGYGWEKGEERRDSRARYVVLSFINSCDRLLCTVTEQRYCSCLRFLALMHVCTYIYARVLRTARA